MAELSKLGTAALAYAKRGWQVFPCEVRGKRPLIPDWPNAATADAEKIRAWWTKWPDANIGFPTGARIALDVDGPEGETALAALEEQHGVLPETLAARTGKGRHLYFSPNGAVIRNSAGKLGAHLDVRGEGGYVILPPSVHASGARYQWTAKIEPVPLPAWVAHLLAEPERTESSDSNAGEEIREGQRNSHLASLAGSMRRRGMSASAIEAALLKENQERCDPPVSEREVKAIAASVARYEPAKSAAHCEGFMLTRLGDLMAEPEEQVSWLLDKILPAGGLGLLAAKPKTGKSTLARCLALAVARGEPFLNRATLHGAVIYLALEEKRSEVRAHFRAMGATGQEDIFIHAASAPQDAIPSITVEVKRHRPVLLIIDPAFRFVRVKDGNDYAQVSAALEPLLTLARENGCHTLLVHHLGKGERSEATDGILGSTALFAAVDSALVMKRYEKYRTLQSRQRYGDDLAEITLEFNPATRTLSLGAERSDAEAQSVSKSILEFLRIAGEPKTEQEIREGVKGETQILAKSLRGMVEQGQVTREGAGKRGSPYRYSFLFACSEDTVQTSKQETEKAADTRINTEPNLVRASEQKPFLVPAFEEGQI